MAGYGSEAPAGHDSETSAWYGTVDSIGLSMELTARLQARKLAHVFTVPGANCRLAVGVGWRHTKGGVLAR